MKNLLYICLCTVAVGCALPEQQLKELKTEIEALREEAIKQNSIAAIEDELKSLIAEVRMRREDAVEESLNEIIGHLEGAERENLAKGYLQQKIAFVKLLVSFEVNKIDVKKDSISEAMAKVKRIESAIAWLRSDMTKNAFSMSAYVLDSERFLKEVAPKLTGRALKVGPKEKHKDLFSALRAAEDGDTIQLGEGEFSPVGRGRGQWDSPVGNIAIRGRGKGKTVLKGSFCPRGGASIQLSDMSIDGNLNEIVELRSGGRLLIENCDIYGYNSGAGGSNAISGSNTAIALVNCTFDGVKNTGGRTFKGNALDLRGENLLYVRGCLFKNNREVARVSFDCLFEKTTFENNDATLYYYSGDAYLRGCKFENNARAIDLKSFKLLKELK